MNLDQGGSCLVSGWERVRVPGVPVFVYHGLADHTDLRVAAELSRYWVSRNQFNAQLDHISRAHCRIVLLRDLNPNETHRRAVLTFDDGNASDFGLAYPLLIEQGAKAEFFVNTATVSTTGYLTWREIIEMQRNGMSFQSHSHDHVDLTRLSNRELERQLNLSKKTLEDRLGNSVDFLAAPLGQMNRKVIDCALQTGYRAVCSARSLPARPGGSKLNRVVVYSATSSREFKYLLACKPSSYLGRIARSPLYRAKNVLNQLRVVRFAGNARRG